MTKQVNFLDTSNPLWKRIPLVAPLITQLITGC